MKKYPTYKPSGVEWMGEVPEHWEVKKLKRLAKICNGQDHKNVWTEDGEYPIIGTGGEFGRANSFLSNGPSVILGRKGTIDKPQFIEHPFWSVDTAYFTQIYNFTDPKFFYYCCTTIQFDRYKYGSAVPSMTQETLNQIPFATPPLPEQTAIATYLDRKTAQIDQTLAEKERLIELFREERQAIINHAVTKGIRPGVKMKDSGVEWIGEVPEGWEVRSLHWLLSEPLKYGANEPAEDDDPTQPRYIRITDFGDDGRLRDETFKSLPIEKAQDYFLKEGDILFARSGATVGKTFQFKNFEGQACFAGYLIKASADREKLLSDFLYYFTKSNAYENWKNAIFNQATIQNIGADKYRNLPIPLASISEQREIIAYVNRKTTQIDTAISGIQQEIALLQEYRQALIFEAVTGKIDVREYTQN